MCRAAQPSTATASPLTWASRPLPSCGPPPHVCSSLACFTASVGQSAARTVDTAGASSVAAASFPRRERTASEARTRSPMLRRASTALVEQLPYLTKANTTVNVDCPKSSTSCVFRMRFSSIALISRLRVLAFSGASLTLLWPCYYVLECFAYSMYHLSTHFMLLRTVHDRYCTAHPVPLALLVGLV